MSVTNSTTHVEQWGIFELALHGSTQGNPYLDVELTAQFIYKHRMIEVDGFYDGDGIYTMADWDRFFRIVQENDPYQHLRSIHNCFEFYDHTKPWVTHLSIQRPHLEQTRTWREQYKKPVVIDECCYEGNILFLWGNISAEKIVRQFWDGTVHGGYVGHGETFLHPQDILWWAKGGILYGQSAPRLAFLRDILKDSPSAGLDPIDGVFPMFACVGQAHDYYLTYFGQHQPAQMQINVPEGEQYKGEVIDTWSMTVTPLQDSIVRGAMVHLPGKPYQALIIRRIY